MVGAKTVDLTDAADVDDTAGEVDDVDGTSGHVDATDHEASRGVALPEEQKGDWLISYDNAQNYCLEATIPHKDENSPLFCFSQFLFTS